MTGLSAQRVRMLRLMGRMPSVQKIESRRAAQQREFDRYKSIALSPMFARYIELKKLADSEIPRQEQERCAQEHFVGSTEQQEIAEYNELKKNKIVRLALKGKGEEKSVEYRRYLELQKKVESKAFQERVRYLKDKKKYLHSETYAKLQELKKLSKSRDMQWYLAHEAKGTFAEQLKERVVFFDDFIEEELNTKNWLPRFFWGDALAGRGYSFIGDPHCYTEGENLTFANSAVTISTHPEERKALAWDKVLGFVSQDYSYTSGLICSGQSFRMLQGRLEAKVRIKTQEGVYHALYLVGDTRAPEIEIFRTTTGKKVGLLSGLLRNEVNTLNIADGVGALPSRDDYFLITFDWRGSTLQWRINDTPYLTLENVKGLDTPMYLVFISGVEPEATPRGDSLMAIDWIRCTAYN